MQVEPQNSATPAGKATTGDRIAAFVLVGFIAVWLAAYAIFAIRARIG
jgi:hypothetical protein